MIVFELLSNMVWPAFTITKEIKVGDILTSLSILISAMAFLRAWTKDREMRDKELADRIRNASAITLAKLGRWQELSLWLFQYTQPLFVETSEMLMKEFDVVAARDFLWRRLNEARAEVTSKIIDEQIEVAYVELCGYHSEVYALFTNAMLELKTSQRDVYDHFAKRSQEVVMSYETRQTDFLTSQLGNALRRAAHESHHELKDRTDQTLKPIQDFLIGIISESDKAVLNRKILPKTTKHGV